MDTGALSMAPPHVTLSKKMSERVILTIENIIFTVKDYFQCQDKDGDHLNTKQRMWRHIELSCFLKIKKNIALYESNACEFTVEYACEHHTFSQCKEMNGITRQTINSVILHTIWRASSSNVKHLKVVVNVKKVKKKHGPFEWGWGPWFQLERAGVD